MKKNILHEFKSRLGLYQVEARKALNEKKPVIHTSYINGEKYVNINLLMYCN